MNGDCVHLGPGCEKQRRAAACILTVDKFYEVSGLAMHRRSHGCAGFRGVGHSKAPGLAEGMDLPERDVGLTWPTKLIHLSHSNYSWKKASADTHGSIFEN